MADKVENSNGIAFTPVDLSEHYGISSEQLKNLRAPAVVPSFIRRYNEEMNEDLATIQESIEAGRSEFIERQAQANAEAYAKAMKTSPVVFDKVVSALSSLCGNLMYNASASEDNMNDYVRDLLGHDTEVRDQTRQGISGASDSAQDGHAGEIDIQIRHNGKPICIFEGLKLNSVNTGEIHDHIAKATVKYNPQGVKDVFVVAYVINQAKRFGDFWNRYSACVRTYSAEDEEYSIVWDEEETETEMSAVRALHGVYNMDGVSHNVYVFAVKIQE